MTHTEKNDKFENGFQIEVDTMVEKAKYNTKQREKLLNYMRAVPGKHITVAEVCEYFTEQGEAIGKTTVYRHLEKMVSAGIVKKYILDANSPACFEYIGEEQSACEMSCFHCKCTVCGKLIHLHCDELRNTGEHILNHHGFEIDARRTVFYGVCESCRK
ncbi:MAG: Fur family transcriptional regulator [Roseburia sp.]